MCARALSQFFTLQLVCTCTHTTIPHTTGLVPLARELMGAIHIAVFVSARLFFAVSCVETSFVPCGFGGVLFNKGAVAVSFKMYALAHAVSTHSCMYMQTLNLACTHRYSTSFCFLSNHLAAHQRKVVALLTMFLIAKAYCCCSSSLTINPSTSSYKLLRLLLHPSPRRC